MRGRVGTCICETILTHELFFLTFDAGRVPASHGQCSDSPRKRKTWARDDVPFVWPSRPRTLGPRKWRWEAGSCIHPLDKTCPPRSMSHIFSSSPSPGRAYALQTKTGFEFALLHCAPSPWRRILISAPLTPYFITPTSGNTGLPTCFDRCCIFWYHLSSASMKQNKCCSSFRKTKEVK